MGKIPEVRDEKKPLNGTGIGTLDPRLLVSAVRLLGFFFLCPFYIFSFFSLRGYLTYILIGLSTPLTK